MKPHQIISLMTFAGADNTLAMADHADHIHVGFHPMFGDEREARARRSARSSSPSSGSSSIDRLGKIDNPTVRRTPSRYASTPTKAPPARAHRASEPAAGPAGARFGFVQWEFPGRLGPEPGRYACAASPATTSATSGHRRRSRRRGARAAPPARAGAAPRRARPEPRRSTSRARP